VVGTTSRRSATSSPIWWRAPPQHGQALSSTSTTCSIRSRWAGSEPRLRLTQAIRRCLARLGHDLLGLGQSCLDLLQDKLELIGIELLGPAAEPVPLQSLDDRLQALDLGLENLQCIKFAGLLKDERLERFDVAGKVRFHEHDEQ